MCLITIFLLSSATIEQIKRKKQKRSLKVARTMLQCQLGHDECPRWLTRHNRFYQFPKELHSLSYHRVTGVMQSIDQMQTKQHPLFRWSTFVDSCFIPHSQHLHLCHDTIASRLFRCEYSWSRWCIKCPKYAYRSTSTTSTFPDWLPFR